MEMICGQEKDVTMRFIMCQIYIDINPTQTHNMVPSLKMVENYAPGSPWPGPRLATRAPWRHWLQADEGLSGTVPLCCYF